MLGDSRVSQDFYWEFSGVPEITDFRGFFFCILGLLQYKKALADCSAGATSRLLNEVLFVKLKLRLWLAFVSVLSVTLSRVPSCLDLQSRLPEYL